MGNEGKMQAKRNASLSETAHRNYLFNSNATAQNTNIQIYMYVNSTKVLGTEGRIFTLFNIKNDLLDHFQNEC
jgi:hypothetical protein